MAINVKTNTASKAKNRLLGVLIALLIVVFVCVITAISASENKKTIAIVKIKEDSPIGANAMITDDMVEKAEMYYKEFENTGVMTFSDGSKKQAIVTWKDKDKVVGTRFSAYYQRGGTPLYWDSTMKEQTKKNSYLYSMNGELLNIQLDTKDFGDMVVPGDVLNIRVAYNKVNYDLPSEEIYKLSLESGSSVTAVTTPVTEKLFNEVSVLDMLNSDGNSIFDIYYSYISKSKSQQSALLKDDEFLNSVQPKTILLEVTAEEADRFMEIQSKKPEFLITLLPRTGSNSIIDSLSDIQSALSGTKATKK